MRLFSLFAILFACCTAPSLCAAQQDGRAKAKMLLGCWKVEPGRFAVIGTTGVDPGGTVLPSLVQFDTLPGKRWSGEPVGRLVRALAPDNRTRYRDGYYLFSGADSLQVDWTNGFVGMTLLLRLDSVVMHGVASAWTDYMCNEQATIVLRRAACPGAR